MAILALEVVVAGALCVYQSISADLHGVQVHTLLTIKQKVQP
jgi:hypothetical protein